MTAPDRSNQPNSPDRQRGFLHLFNLRKSQADASEIDASIREGTRLGGTNLWVLVLAIVIASVGLNVNSTAVIIGAMLISPLMGPIIATGYGAAVHDSALIRRALTTLAIFVGLSLLASTAYFMLSPLKQAHSELLARTSPNVWDVLIAFFGGAAGMIGLTRREKTTLIPGVAIATALMPPLCTAGYGLASGDSAFFLGAFYLFLINGVFIALATLAIARVLRLPARTQPTASAERRVRIVAGLVMLAALLPSAYLAWRLVHEEIFNVAAEAFVQRSVLSREDITLLAREIEPQQRLITLTLISPVGVPVLLKTLQSEMAAAGIRDARLLIRSPAQARPDIGALRRDLQAEVLRGTLSAAEAQAARIAQLESRLDDLTRRSQQSAAPDLAQIEREAAAQWPDAGRFLVTRARPDPGSADRAVVVFTIDSHRRWPVQEINRLERWLQARLPDAETHVVKGNLTR